jgi:WD40 repeat protein
MTSPMPFELTDAAIERMLEARAGSAAPAGLVPAVGSAIEQTPQRSAGLVPQLRSIERTMPRGWLIAAVLALVAVTIAAAVIGSRLIEPPKQLVVVPVVPSPSASPSSTAAPRQAIVPTPVSAPTPLPTSPVSSPIAPPPADSPLIVYAVARDRVNLYTLDPATGHKVQLGTLQKRSTFSGQSIRWSGDRQQAFVFADSDSISAVVNVKDRSVDPFSLPPPGGRYVLSPAGDRVASLEGSTMDGLTLMVWTVEGDELVNRPMTEIVEGELRMFWAPDGTALLIDGCSPCDPTLKEPAPGQHYHLFYVPLDGGPVQPLLDESNWIGAAAWSPDGASIVYENPCTDGACSAPGLSVLRRADNVSTRLTTGNDSGASWSPDGSRIAFVRFGCSSGGIYVMDADGGHVTRLTTSTSQDGGDRDVHWSPDGRSIVFSRGSEYGDLYIVSSSGGTPRLLVKNAVADW